jgi:type I restriction enzyme S subunit
MKPDPRVRGWRHCTLGDILQRHNEIIHPGDRTDGEAVFVGLEHIEPQSGRRIGSSKIDLGKMTGRKPTFRTGLIVYGYLRPYLNKVWVADFDGVSSVDQFAFAVNVELADTHYISWFMRSEAFLRRSSVVTTTGQLPRIGVDEILAVEINLPPLPEQRRLAAELTAALAAVDRARRAAEERLAAATALPAAYLREVFDSLAAGVPTVQIGDVSDIVSGITLGRRTHADAGRRVSYLRVANVKDGFFDLSDVYSIQATEEEIKKLRLQRGDLLLTEGGDRDKLGRGTFWNCELLECVHQNHIYRVRLDGDRFDPLFVSLMLQSEYGKRYFLVHAKQTTGIATINQQVLRRFPVLAFPLPEQRRLAAALSRKLAAAEALSGRLWEELAGIAALSGALFRQAFGGEPGP